MVWQTYNTYIYVNVFVDGHAWIQKNFLGETSERGLCLEEWGGPNAVFGNFNVNKRNFSTPGGPTPSPQLQIRASKGVQWQIISVQGFIGNMRASGWGDNKATLNICF